jgi:Rrf2 family protein
MFTSVLRISEASSLAMHTAAMLAAEPEKMLSVHHVAAALKVSQAHLAKVLGRLGHAGLVRSVRGPKGGFLLQKDPAAVTLLEVYEAIEGPLHPTGCLLGEPVCGGRKCVLGNLARSVDRQVKDYLSKTTLKKLADVYRS